MTNLSSFLFFGCLFFAGSISGDWLNPKWFLIAFVAVFLFCKKLWSFDRLCAITIGYTLFNGLMYSMTPYTFTDHIDATTAVLLSSSGLKSVICVVALVWVTSKITLTKQTMRAFGAIAVAWLTFGMIFDWYCKGPDLNKSLSATFLALILPYHFGALVVYVTTGIVAGGRIGVAAMVMATIAYCAAKVKGWARLALVAVALSGVVVAGLEMWQGKISLSGRDAIWRTTIASASESPEMLWTGFGLGSYYVFGPAIDKELSSHKWSIKNGVPIQMHNDYLQCIFELGFIGLALWLALYLKCFWVARREPWVVAFWVSLAVSCFGNFPHHLGSDSFLIALMVRHCLARNPQMSRSF